MSDKVLPNEKGEFDLLIGGEEYTMRYTYGALKELEKHFKVKGPQKIFESLGNWSTDDHVALILAGLKRGSGKGLTVEQLEDMLTFDQMRYYIETISKAMLAGREEDEKHIEDKDEEDPTSAPEQANAGTGAD